MTRLLRGKGVRVVTDAKEFRRVYREMASPENRADVEMMAAARRNPSTLPASGNNTAPTIGGGISRANVEISDKNRKGLTENLDGLHRSISQGMTGVDFLRAVKKAFGFEKTDNPDVSEYAMTREGAAGLSALTTESVFKGKGNASLGEKQGAEAKGSASSMAERAVAAGRELGVEVEVVHDAETIEHEDARMQRRMRSSKGWYDPKTGRIVVVVGNHSSAADVEATVLHEIVGHKGLRGVVGEERFNRFLEKVYFGASEQVRSRINELARENGWGLREATEEYMAQMAERGFRDRLERGFWGRVKNFFGDMMSAARIGLGFRVNDRDLRWMLWRSYKLQRGEGRGVMGQAENVMMQRKLGVGDYGEGVRFRF